MSDKYLKIKDISEKKYDKRKKKYDNMVNPSVKHEVLSYLIIVAAAVLFAVFLLKFVVFNAFVPSASMVSTIDEGDRLIGFRLSYMFSEPQRGDIVIFKFPDDESKDYVKRIIGLPGETVHIQNNKVYINDVLFEEDYLNEPMELNENLTFNVPDGCYFMLGDNRNVSKDSRAWDNPYVSKDKIEAKAIFRYFSGTKKFINFKLVK